VSSEAWPACAAGRAPAAGADGGGLAFMGLRPGAGGVVVAAGATAAAAGGLAAGALAAVGTAATR
jgi:hypothetical protein